MKLHNGYTLNVKLLRQIQQHIREEPRRLNMDTWGYRNRGGVVSPASPPCGTAGCIAGWADILTNPEAEDVSEFRGAEALFRGEWVRPFNSSPSYEGRLFYVGHWPPQFARRYRRAVRPATRARITCERIDHYIQTRGQE